MLFGAIKVHGRDMYVIGDGVVVFRENEVWRTDNLPSHEALANDFYQATGVQARAALDEAKVYLSDRVNKIDAAEQLHTDITLARRQSLELFCITLPGAFYSDVKGKEMNLLIRRSDTLWTIIELRGRNAYSALEKGIPQKLDHYIFPNQMEASDKEELLKVLESSAMRYFAKNLRG